MLDTITYTDFYSRKIDDLTLAQAIKLHYELNPQFTPWDRINNPVLQKMIKFHDHSHVIYGCDTKLLGEVRVQFWNNFGSKVPKNPKDFISAITDKDSRKLLTPDGLISSFVTNLPEILRVRKQAKLMSKKWVFFDEERYINTTIGAIRQEYNIVIL